MFNRLHIYEPRERHLVGREVTEITKTRVFGRVWRPTQSVSIDVPKHPSASVDGPTAVCRNVNFGGDNALIDLSPPAGLSPT